MKLLPNILRVEQNHKSLEGMRRAFDINKKGPVIMGDVLDSKAKPLYKEHQNIIKFANEISLFDEYDNYDIAIQEFGWRGILEHCNNDYDLFMNFIKHCFQKKEYKCGDRTICRRNRTYQRVIKKIKE